MGHLANISILINELSSSQREHDNWESKVRAQRLKLLSMEAELKRKQARVMRLHKQASDAKDKMEHCRTTVQEVSSITSYHKEIFFEYSIIYNLITIAI